MSNNVKVNVDVSDNGTTSKLTKVVEVLKGTLKGAADAASTIRIPSAVLAARQGVTASNQQRQPVAAKAASAAKQEMQDYDKVRGGLGTGAAGRDFAKQSEGLGGLVRVYATFAANLFAVTAAYSALSKAADTSNMVKGLDQLGASSGRALGSLAKQLNQVTDGAISMRDAMTATVSASAGGMTNAAILRMGVVAKQASQALGVAMPDALSRISRGITKLEPELLDEIGIMVRVDTASQNYAKTLGKSASALTDFEKRQGFANAVLEQGEKKFGAIKLDTNPYDKLLASMQNLAQSGLELVNKVLGPLINMLSSSPTALATVMAGIGVVLLKQAVPAIGAWRDGLKALALEAGKTANRINSEFAIYQVEQTNKHADELEKRITKEKAAAVRSLSIAQDATKASGLSKGKVYELTQNIPKDATEATAAYKLLDAQIKSNTTRGLNLAASDSKAAKAALDRAEALKKLKDQMPELIRLEGELVAARQKADAEMQADPKYFSEAGIRERNAKKARLAASKAEVLSNVAANTQVMGIAGAWNQTKADVAEKGLKGLDAGVTKLRAGLIIGTSALGSLVNSLGAIGMAVGLAVGAFALLSSWLSKNGEQAEKFNNSVTGVTDAVKTLSSTLDFIADKDPLSVFSVETIQARANALQGLSDSLTSLVKDFDRLQKSSNWFDKGIDALWDSIGKGSADVLSTNIAKAISSGLAGASAGPMKAEAIEKLQAILGKGIDVTNIKQVNAELRKLNDAEVSAAGAEINKILQDISRNANNAATDLVSATTRLKEISDLVQTQNLALMPTDAVGKLGATILSASADLAKGLQDPINGMLVLNKLVNDSKSLSILSPSVASDLIGAKKEIDELTESYSKLQSDLAKGEKELQDLRTSGNLVNTTSGPRGNLEVGGITEAGKAVTESIARINASIVSAEAKMKAAGAELSMKVANDFVNVGLTNLNQSVKTAMAEGGVTAAKGYLSVLKDAGVGTADAEAKLAQQEIGMQRQVLEASYKQIKAQYENSNRLEELSLNLRINSNALEINSTSEVRREKALVEYAGLMKEKSNLAEKTRITSLSPKEALALKAGGDISTEVLAGMAPYMSTLSGYLAGLAKLGGASAAANIQAFANKEKEKTTDLQKVNTARVSGIDTELSAVNSAISLSAEYDKQLADKKSLLELEKLGLQFLNDNLAIERDLRIIQEASKGKAVDKTKILEAQNAAEKARVDRAAKYDQAANLLATEKLKTELTGLEEIRKKQQTNDTLVRTETDAITSIKLTQYESELQFLQQIGALSAEDLTRKETSIALEQQALDYSKQTNDLASTYVDKFTELENKKTLAAKAGASTAGFQAEQDLLVASYLRQAEAQALGNEYKLRNIALTGEQKALQEAQTADMEKMVSATESLSSIFGELGNNIGLAGQALLKMAQDDVNYASKKLAIEKQLDDNLGDPKKEAEGLKSLAKLEKEKAKGDLANIANVAGATKKMFSEKTAAYKILNGVEKAVHVVKMGMMAAELVADLTGTTTSVANSATRTGASVVEAGVDGVKAVVKSIASLPFPLNIAAGAATAAVVAGLLSSIGGDIPTVGSASLPGGTTSADRQEVQGTGQAWVGGKKVDTGGGVFGDSEAKSTAIVDSLEIMRANSIIGLDYDNKMLKAMEKLASSVTGAAKSLYSIPGLRQGTNFGTAEGSAITNAGFGASIPVVGKLLSSVFGGKTTVNNSIQSAGIQFKGTFDAVMKGVEGSLLQYKDILTQTTKKGGWFSSDKSSSSLNRETQVLADNVQRAFTDIFGDANELFVELGKKTGVTAQTISDLLKTFNTSFDIDIRGLTGDQLLAELNGVIGNVLSTASESLFRGFESFRNFGEDYLETVVRVVDANNKANIALTSLGKSLEYISGFDTFNISDDLVSAAGGLDIFMEQADFFKENFLTTADKLAPVEKSVKNQLVSLGLSADTTTIVFKELVWAQDLNTKAGRSMYQSLMELAPGFNLMTSLTETLASETEKLSSLDIEILKLEGQFTKALKLERERELTGLSDTNAALQVRVWRLQDEAALLDKKTSQEIAIYGLINNSAAALQITREKELATLDDQLKPAQLYIYALQDEATLKGKLKTAYEKEKSAVKGTIDSISSLIKTLATARDSMLLGDKTILSPTEKYAEAKRQAAAVAAIATGIATTDSEIAARNEAVSKLPSVTATFLDASRELYASSEQYTKDFNSVLKTLDDTSISLALQQTDTEKQLELITSLDSNIEKLLEPTLSSAEYLKQLNDHLPILLAAKEASAISGSVASGGTNINPISTAIPDTVASAVPKNISTEINSYYEKYLKRSAEQEGMNYWLNQYYDKGENLSSIESYISESPEGKAQLLYKLLANRIGETGGVKFWMNAITSGMPKNEIVYGFAKGVMAQEPDNATSLAKKVAAGTMAAASIPGFAKGGLASGIAIVGEQGPELVDFKTPGRVYSNNASNDLLNNKELINEIKNLRSELTQLRKEQQEQTGYLIKSNYDANAKAADKVVSATEDASSQMEWKARSAVKIA